MRRVVSVWFPCWATDRIHRRRSRQGGVDGATSPLATALHDGRRRVLAAVDADAAGLGLRPGLAAAQALMLVPELEVVEAELEADADALSRLAAWCHRYTPLASACAPDGLWLDIGGCAHLFGGEAGLLGHLLGHLGRHGLQARAAVADTPGAAHAVARHGAAGAAMTVPQVVLPGEHAAALAGLPVESLRLPPELGATLRRLGFEQVGHLVRIPPALLARRFGVLPGLRLDQAYGRVAEPLTPVAPKQELQHRLAFLEPLLTAEALQVAITHLVGPVCEAMEHRWVGARQLDLLFERVDNQIVAVRVGTVRASRDRLHLARMLEDRLELVDPGLGVEAMRLVVTVAEALRWEQQDRGAGEQDVARLVDRLSNRLGAERVYRAAPVPSAVPERSVRKAPAMGAGGAMEVGAERVPEARAEIAPEVGATRQRLRVVSEGAGGGVRDEAAKAPALTVLPGGVGRLRVMDPLDGEPPLQAWVRKYDASRMGPRGADAGAGRPLDVRAPGLNVRRSKSGLASTWPGRLQAPARLLTPPRPISAMAALPDKPPVAFTWRRHRHRIRHSDGPERVCCEWWQGDGEAVRDYFLVENESGQRFWLFRHGDGLHSATGSLEWYLHGLF